MDVTKLTCRRCGGEFAMHKIRMDPVTKSYVCLDCMQVSDRLSDPTKITSTKDMDKLRRKRRMQKSDNAEFITYRCPKCRYKTRFKTEKIPKRCTYCGTPVDLDMNQESDMDKLIRDVEESGFYSK
jgi:protein-arginine kinase activator protein McsA